MIIDTSAIVALLLDEPDRPLIENAIVYTPPLHRLVAIPTLVEMYVAIHRKQGSKGIAELTTLLNDLQLQAVAFDTEHYILACEAYQRFNRGKNGLNFGDCFSYALAKARNEPLLCKGDDFKNTDLQLVNY